jgi:SanA protein
MRLRHWIGLLAGALVLAIVTVLALASMARGVTNAWGQAYVVDDRAQLPKVDAILVLGTSPYGYHGQDQYTLSYRLNVAAGLWNGDFADRLLVSGIKIDDDYDEASLMRDALVARGIPASAIELDHKGNRTWDSVYRARHVFGVHRLIIVSQRDHLPRAIFLARHIGMEAWGVPAIGDTYAGLYAGTVGNLASLIAFYDLMRGTAP